MTANHGSRIGWELHTIVGICEFKDGWRVSDHANDLYWWPDRHRGKDRSKGNWVQTEDINPLFLNEVFKKSKVFKNPADAAMYAVEVVSELAKTKDNVYIREIYGFEQEIIE